MEVETACETPRRAWISDLWRLGFIMLLALTTRSWIALHTEVISRDGIGFIRYALQLENPPTAPKDPSRSMTRAEVLEASFHPPGYAVSIWAMSLPVRYFMGGITCDSMTISAQLASILASLLLAVPMYYLGKLVFDRQTAFVGTLLFLVLPVSSSVASDGLSDNLFLLFSVTSTWLAALGLRRDSSLWFGAAGLMSGLTYLVRPEGLIVVVAVGLVLCWCKLRGEIGWRSLLVRGTLLLAGTLAVMAPYVATIGRLTNKPTGGQLFRWMSGEEMKPSWMNRSQGAAPRSDVAFPLAEVISDGAQPNSLWAGKAVIKEIFKASFYALPLFAAIGLTVLWPRMRGDSAAVMIVTISLCHSLLLWQVAKGAGYVSERHTLLIVLYGCYLVAASCPVLGEKLASFRRLRSWGTANTWSVIVAVIIVGTCAPAALRPLHGSRSGHRIAGLWIAAQAQPGDYVLDPFAWAEYYSGHMRLEQSVLPCPHTMYILCESNMNMHARLHAMHVARFFAERGQIVYHWPEDVPVEKGKVFVYRWDGDDFCGLWFQAYEEMKRKAAGGVAP